MSRKSLKNICRLIESVKTELPPEEDFLNDLKRSIELNDKKNARKPSLTYKPSSMNCIRNMYYQRIGVEQDESVSSYNLIGICNSGTDTHVRIQTAVSEMKDNGIECEYINVGEYIRQRHLENIEIKMQSGMETKLFHKTLSMSFMCDGIIRYKGHYYILELKTESAYKWLNRKGVDESHYNQGTAYSLALELPEVIFVYINRDTLDMKSYMFIPTDEMKNNLAGTILNCEEYVRTLKVPPKPVDVSKKACTYCNYKNSCKRSI